ncbi:hypothetical protein Bhyg_14162 [Pseudolycoriella hygida]|uniref:Uncharacterized protein n=1 Tax=Pseudolycoriella hygida TaxID=35572 RepID=A0A9Q0RX07_9DIPT|nr:hypothetical protein Bhyg_14162 [Pseudolycoriella hygida]
MDDKKPARTLRSMIISVVCLHSFLCQSRSKTNHDGELWCISCEREGDLRTDLCTPSNNGKIQRNSSPLTSVTPILDASVANCHLGRKLKGLPIENNSNVSALGTIQRDKLNLLKITTYKVLIETPETYAKTARACEHNRCEKSPKVKNNYHVHLNFPRSIQRYSQRKEITEPIL